MNLAKIKPLHNTASVQKSTVHLDCDFSSNYQESTQHSQYLLKYNLWIPLWKIPELLQYLNVLILRQYSKLVTIKLFFGFFKKLDLLPIIPVCLPLSISRYCNLYKIHTEISFNYLAITLLVAGCIIKWKTFGKSLLCSFMNSCHLS